MIGWNLGKIWKTHPSSVTAAYDQGGTENPLWIMYLATISLQFEQILIINIFLVQSNI